MVLGLGCSCSLGEFLDGKFEGFQQTGNLKEYSATVGVIRGKGQVVFDKEKINDGASLTITVKPDYGNKVKIFKINNIDYTEKLKDNAFVIDNITSDIVVDVQFEELEGYVSYVAAENVPVIDGEIDNIWDTSYTFSVKNQHLDNGDEIYEDTSYVNVLWNENGLYYLCYVYDGDLVYGDVCNLWVSEVYSSEPHLRDPITGEWSLVNYSANPEDGTYAITAAADGNNYVYTGFDVSEYWTCAAQITDFGYILEIFMPRVGKTPLTAGASIGFDVSIDYYSTGGNGRDYYANWNGYVLKDEGPSCPVEGWLTSHGYWTCPAALKEIILLPEKR